jgi:unsaturated rhamnogalacturonyl hydrolase
MGSLTPMIRMILCYCALLGCAEDSLVPPPDWCSDQPPDATCFAAKRPVADPHLQQAVALAADFMRRHPADTLTWGWEDGVFVIALSELHRVTADPALASYLHAFLDHHLAKGYSIETSDDCPPTAIAAYLGGYVDLLADLTNYVDQRARRTEEGALNHNGVLELIDATAWVDSLFMFGIPLMRQAEFGGQQERLDFYGEQFRIFVAVLQRQGGLFQHADPHWVSAQEDGVFWARGNGWVTAAGADYLRLMRNRGSSDEVVAQALRQQITALIQQQDSSGLWWTLLSHPGELYLETSASALFAYGMARAWRYGVVGDEVLQPIRKAVAGLQTRIEARDEGLIVTGISGPTMAGNKQVYANVRLRDDLSFGVGTVILALLERAGLPEE